MSACLLRERPTLGMGHGANAVRRTSDRLARRVRVSNGATQNSIFDGSIEEYLESARSDSEGLVTNREASTQRFGIRLSERVFPQPGLLIA